MSRYPIVGTHNESFGLSDKGMTISSHWAEVEADHGSRPDYARHGFRTTTPVDAKSATFLVTTVMP
jgi:hypothetical protein